MKKPKEMSRERKPLLSSGLFKQTFGLVIILVLALAPNPAPAQQNDLTKYDPARKISFACDRFEVDNGLHSFRYLGNVVAIQGDAVLNADLIVVNYDPPPKEEKTGNDDPGALEAMPSFSSGGIKSMVATGRVKLRHKDKRAICRQAVYNEKARTITLSGKPKLWQGGNYLTGKRIILYLNTEKVVVTGGRGARVTGRIFPSAIEAELDDTAKERLKNLRNNPPAISDNVSTEDDGNN